MLSAQDFTKGVDLTGVDPVTVADLNVLVDNATPSDNRGLVLTTTDAFDGTPDVPDPSAIGYSKFKRYIWLRIPYGVSDTVKAYGWVDTANSDSSLLKWKQLVVDFTSVNNSIDTLITQIDAIQLSVDNSSATSSAANTAASSALSTANAASSTAATAAANATTAKTTADEAKAGVTTLTASVTALNALIGVKKAPNDVMTVAGVGGQLLRTNNDKTAVEWFSEINLFAKVVEKKAKGVAADAIAASGTEFIRDLNTIVDNMTPAIALVGSYIAFPLAGTYLIEAESVIFGTNKISGISQIVYDDGTVHHTGCYAYVDTGGAGAALVLRVSGRVNVTDISKKIGIRNYVDFNGTAKKGLAANYSDEIYATVNIRKLC